MQLGYFETLMGVAELAVALAGFSGVVVVFGSRNEGGWKPGDRLRLEFLIESSFTAAGFAILALCLLYAFPEYPQISWIAISILWSLFMLRSLYSSHSRIKQNLKIHDDIDKISNGLVATFFYSLIIAQIVNVLVWEAFWPVLSAICFNLMGAGMQFARLIKSAFHD